MPLPGGTTGGSALVLDRRTGHLTVLTGVGVDQQHATTGTRRGRALHRSPDGHDGASADSLGMRGQQHPRLAGGQRHAFMSLQGAGGTSGLPCMALAAGRARTQNGRLQPPSLSPYAGKRESDGRVSELL